MKNAELIDNLTTFFDPPIEITPMVGSTSADLYEVRAGADRYVLRVFRAERWQTPARALSDRESLILQALASTSISAPRPLGRLPGNGVLMSWLPGRVDLPRHPDARWIDELARTLADLHACRVRVPYGYETWNEVVGLGPPDWWRDTDLWNAAQSAVRHSPPFDPVFIHRDYHPTNVLWEDGHITGVVDWINACTGPAGIDVAHCRLNLSLMYGMTAAEAFLDAYRNHAPGYQHHPYWDLDDAMGALPDVQPYPPWEVFGLKGLTTDLVRGRMEVFIKSSVSSLPAR